MTFGPAAAVTRARMSLMISSGVMPSASPSKLRSSGAAGAGDATPLHVLER